MLPTAMLGAGDPNRLTSRPLLHRSWELRTGFEITKTAAFPYVALHTCQVVSLGNVQNGE